MSEAIIYIHGKGGNADEAEHYKELFSDHDVIGLNYVSETPWEAKKEFSTLFDSIATQYDSITVIANSIGAFFTMHALADKEIAKAYFISPVVDMHKLIADMMMCTGVSEKELSEKKEIKTQFGETLSWDYLQYVRNNPVEWDVPTHILYGGNDNLTSYETVSAFANKINAALTVMHFGEHWFHTEEQMKFLDEWITQN